MIGVNYSNIQILDFGLNYLHHISENEDRYISQNDLAENLQGAVVRNINSVCQKLFKDGYITTDGNSPYYGNGENVKLSFDGKTFKEAGGYAEQEKKKSIEEEAQNTENRIRIRNEKITRNAAILAWVGAMGYFLIELYKWIF